MLDNLTYDELLNKYANGIPCPDDFTFPTHVIDKWAQSDPSLLAIHWVAPDFKNERKITYKELAEQSNRMAVAFVNQGIKKHSRGEL
jgi:acyl-coenzyme A synthetase/AMP-(fatty) acid ligase